MAGTPGGFLKGLTAGAKKGVEGFDTSIQGIREAREKLKDRMTSRRRNQANGGCGAGGCGYAA